MLEFLDEVVKKTIETIIETFSTKMGITSSGFDFENTLLNGEKGNIKSSSTEIEDQDLV